MNELRKEAKRPIIITANGKLSVKSSKRSKNVNFPLDMVNTIGRWTFMPTIS